MAIKPYNFAGKKILIVEDIDTNFLILSRFLNKTGAEISRAVDGNEAIMTVASDNSIDLVLMDIRLPGMDGFEATRRIKKMKDNLTVIAETAYAISYSPNEFREAGFDDYIFKPISQQSILEKVAGYLQ